MERGGTIAGHTARLEPKCWAMLALGACDALASAVPDLIRVADFLKGTARDDGLLVDSLGVPPNLASNGLAALTLAQHREMLNAPATSRLLAALHRVKGLALPQNDEVHQDNSLQGWPWIDGTFSWVAPTACCLLALKKTAAIEADVATGQRIDEAEQLLFDRVCDSGGWNYGNASVQGTHLRAYVSDDCPRVAGATRSSGSSGGAEEPDVSGGESDIRGFWDGTRPDVAVSQTLRTAGRDR